MQERKDVVIVRLGTGRFSEGFDQIAAKHGLTGRVGMEVRTSSSLIVWIFFAILEPGETARVLPDDFIFEVQHRALSLKTELKRARAVSKRRLLVIETRGRRLENPAVYSRAHRVESQVKLATPA